MTGREEIDNKVIQRTKKKLENAPNYVVSWMYNGLYNTAAPSTRDVWLGQVLKFLKYINADINSIDVNDIKREEVEKYFATLINKSGSCKCTTRSCLRNFFRYLQEHGYNISPDYVPKAQRGLLYQDLTRIKSERIRYSAEDYQDFNDRINKEKNICKRRRNKAILYLLANTGIRRGAIISADIDKLNDENHILTLVEKGNLTIDLPLDDETWNAIQDWLQVRDKYIKKPTNALFISRKGTRLNPKTVYSIVMKYTKHSPHKLRANFITNAKENGADLSDIQIAVNHRNISTTRRYIIEDERTTRQNVMAKASMYHKM